MEEKHVPTPAKLAAVCFQVAKHDARVRNVEDGKLGDALRMDEGDAPRDGSAPIVTGEEDAGPAELIGDGEDVGSEMGKRVGGGAARLAGFVVAALIGNDDAETRGGKGVNLFAPGIPEFGKAVEEDGDRAVGRAGGNSVQIDRAVVKSQVFENGWHSCKVYTCDRKSKAEKRILRDGSGFEAVGGDVIGGGRDF